MLINNKEVETGDILIIKKGSTIFSTHPNREKTISRINNKVKFHHALGDDVVWAGSSCYWNWTDKTNVIGTMKHDDIIKFKKCKEQQHASTVPCIYVGCDKCEYAIIDETYKLLNGKRIKT